MKKRAESWCKMFGRFMCVCVYMNNLSRIRFEKVKVFSSLSICFFLISAPEIGLCNFPVSHHEFSAINGTFKSTFASYFRNIKKFALKYLPLYICVVVADARLTTTASILLFWVVCLYVGEMKCQLFLKQKPKQYQQEKKIQIAIFKTQSYFELSVLFSVRLLLLLFLSFLFSFFKFYFLLLHFYDFYQLRLYCIIRKKHVHVL